ncbi:MAG: hypothetical protein ACOVQS_14745 [Chitinophagaceae bacterium]|jgi:hypothetical protein
MTKRERHSIHSYLCTRDQPRQIDQRRYIKEETRQRIGAKGCWGLDV